jgi:hypothetical protein
VCALLDFYRPAGAPAAETESESDTFRRGCFAPGGRHRVWVTLAKRLVRIIACIEDAEVIERLLT